MQAIPWNYGMKIVQKRYVLFSKPPSMILGHILTDIGKPSQKSLFLGGFGRLSAVFRWFSAAYGHLLAGFQPAHRTNQKLRELFYKRV